MSNNLTIQVLFRFKAFETYCISHAIRSDEANIELEIIHYQTLFTRLLKSQDVLDRQDGQNGMHRLILLKRRLEEKRLKEANRDGKLTTYLDWEAI